MKVRTIITGTTGMVGRGVLLSCLNNENVEAVLSVSRRSIEITHPKLKELLVQDFMDLTDIASQMSGYNACYFCIGITSFRKSEEAYSKITYELGKYFAKTLYKVNPDMTFCFVSGAGSDETEKSSTMWKRVKGKGENAIFQTGFKDAYAFRPAFIKPRNDIPTQTAVYKILMPFATFVYPLIKKLFPKYTSTTQGIATAMVKVSQYPIDKKILESWEINELGA